jgi:hypothetical protein
MKKQAMPLNPSAAEIAAICAIAAPIATELLSLGIDPATFAAALAARALRAKPRKVA